MTDTPISYRRRGVADFTTAMLATSIFALTTVMSVAAPAPAAETSAAGGLEEIIVTATKRTQNLMEVPIAVSAFSEAALQNSGIRDIRNLVALSPSLNFQTPGGDSDSSVRIRGMGTTSTNVGLESAVGVVIDGVPRARTGVALSELGDIERIEVLRGPQGTLFGRNTSAGLINVITKNPNMKEFEGYVEGTYGNYDYYRLNGAVSGPLVEDVLGVRIEGVVQKRNGFLHEVNTDTDTMGLNRSFLRGKLQYQPNENLRIKLSADYTNRNEDCCTAVFSLVGANAIKGQTIAATHGVQSYGSTHPFDRLAARSPGRVNQEDVKDWGVGLEVNWDAGVGEVVSVTSYRDWKANRGQDFDHSGVDLGYIPKDGIFQQFKVFSQELRFQGKSGPLDWLVGAWYSHEDITDQRAFLMGVDMPLMFNTAKPAVLAAFRPGDGGYGFSNQKGEDYAAFTHNTYAITEALKFTVGARITRNKKKVDLTANTINPACDTAVALNDPVGIGSFCASFWDSRLNPAGGKDSRAETALTGTVNLSYEFSPEANSYISYSRGYKSGGYNLDRAGFSTPATPNAADLSFGKETVDAYEVGFKSQFFDNTVRFNAAVFYQAFKGFQSIQYTGVSFIVFGLPKAITKGAEVELTWAPVKGLTLTGATTYADAYYTSDPGNRAFAGKPMEMSPKWTLVGSATYDFPIPGTSLKGLAYADIRWVSTYMTASFGDINRQQDAFALVNGRLALSNESDSWRVELWARNLFNQDYYRRVIPATFQAGSYSAFLGDPRTYGITVRTNF
ncbi:TonB-dependent receptor [Govanella unica]|uniref:TonB-dependent receptor n=1 Tax=Govanella unica TaxID=2975056 RepID=A0A9X3TWY7_9PROT|nr:TonB-dependent receptor [Govania unica]MDA5193520.1 TonB-dependent receptor [Govania unica]